MLHTAVETLALQFVGLNHWTKMQLHPSPICIQAMKQFTTQFSIADALALMIPLAGSLRLPLVSLWQLTLLQSLMYEQSSLVAFDNTHHNGRDFGDFCGLWHLIVMMALLVLLGAHGTTAVLINVFASKAVCLVSRVLAY